MGKKLEKAVLNSDNSTDGDAIVQDPGKRFKAISARIDNDLYKKAWTYAISKEIKFNDLIKEALDTYVGHVQLTP